MEIEKNSVLIPGEIAISDSNLVIHILSSAPKLHEGDASTLEDKMTNESSAIDIEDMRKKIMLCDNS